MLHEQGTHRGTHKSNQRQRPTSILQTQLLPRPFIDKPITHQHQTTDTVTYVTKMKPSEATPLKRDISFHNTIPVNSTT